MHYSEYDIAKRFVELENDGCAHTHTHTHTHTQSGYCKPLVYMRRALISCRYVQSLIVCKNADIIYVAKV